MNSSWQDVSQKLSQSLDSDIKFIDKISVSGGCINQSWRLTDSNNKSWFVKTNSPNSIDMFIAESEGLDEIRKSESIRIPYSYLHGVTDEFSYLILGNLSLDSRIHAAEMGEQLAKMHKFHHLAEGEKIFGWYINNTIGTTNQSNKLHKTWPTFYKKERLIPQLEHAKKNCYSSKAYEAGFQLANSLDEFFTQYDPKPSLLHGDLWSGNCATDEEGSPVIFDPAVYYGDREADIAMTELFGGFSSEFYASYNNGYPLDQGYKVRKTLYNLYHVLNHFNLFGGSYAQQAESMTNQLLAELK